MKRTLAMIHDMVVAALAITLSLIFRLGTDDVSLDQTFGLTVGIYTLIAAVTFRLLGLGRGIWRFASLTDLRAIALASTFITLVFLASMFLVNRLDAVPRSVPLIAWFVLIVLLGAPRIIYRVWKDGGFDALRGVIRKDGAAEGLLLIGTVTESDRIIRTYNLEMSRRYKVRGIVDYDQHNSGRRVRGVRVLGELDELPDIVKACEENGEHIDALLVATTHDHKPQLAKVTALAAQLKLPVRQIADSIVRGSFEPSLRDITLDDLLGRPPVRLDVARIRGLISGRVVVVTGAGGSIGSEIARQVAANAPACLILIDHSEYNIYEIDQELQRLFPDVARVPLIASVRDAERIGQIFADHRPNIVFHAAALKHVPLIEANICEGVLTNAIGTRTVAQAAIASNVDAMVMISTDKAIRPSSVMGATKRAAEAFCQMLDIETPRTRFITVRFGNVLGSAGSVVPLFTRQIMSGGPVTVTHPEMRRYFMTIREATELVLQAAVAGLADNQRGRILVLDMGDPVRIVDLARTMIMLAGHKPDKDIAIAFTGLRPGEKLFEELFDPDEPTVKTEAEGVFMAAARIVDRAALDRAFAVMEAAALAGDAARARTALTEIVPELGEPASKPELVPDAAPTMTPTS